MNWLSVSPTRWAEPVVECREEGTECCDKGVVLPRAIVECRDELARRGVSRRGETTTFSNPAGVRETLTRRPPFGTDQKGRSSDEMTGPIG
ncbi:hypothetical protein GOEFS_042_00360 [Gordonia effusa NBRC 100432]|uniref:Uncharacterized protein n=1 Tax=Gordonia effusa NBRC 100432 TaxID=1077974 RepID=H0QYP4_9ACTN|nr:hypothetical protein GOEFS_042_00360 [Gordonia effusa NBRC 100432]